MSKRCFPKMMACIIMLLSFKTIHAQNNVMGGWYFVNFNYFFNQKFNIYSEIQTRSQHVFGDFYYHELKGGLSYNLKPNQSFLLGFGNYETYTFPGNYKKPVSVNENRVWEQFTMSNYISRVKLEHRYRVEQRWLNGDFNNRFRYRLFATVPINNNTVKANTFFVAAFDEVFFTDVPPYFLRNRIFGGVGYQFKSCILQTGLIRQFDYRTTDNGSGKNFFYTSLIINGGHPSKEPHHTDAD